MEQSSNNIKKVLVIFTKTNYNNVRYNIVMQKLERRKFGALHYCWQAAENWKISKRCVQKLCSEDEFLLHRDSEEVGQYQNVHQNQSMGEAEKDSTRLHLIILSFKGGT